MLFPATVAKPGQPMGLKSDEPAYYLMSLSLLHDRDLRCGVEDIRRLAIEFPNNLVNNLILMSGDGWRTTYFGKPWVASLLAVPGVALAGSDGFVATNMALLLLSVWLGALYLRRHNPEWLALLFSAARDSAMWPGPGDLALWMKLGILGALLSNPGSVLRRRRA